MKFRLLAAVAGLIGFALLATARGLEPDPRGYGTHEQLGLTPCFFQKWTGHVCPTCGATTAWSHLVRGDIHAAVAANLGGAMLCAVTIVAAPWLMACALAGRWLVITPSLLMALLIGTVWLGAALLDWLRRLYFQ